MKLSRNIPVKKLTKILKKTSGRDNRGTISTRHKGGRKKRMYRMIDFKRNMYDIPAIVKKIEYDPNRSANIALIEYENGIQAYILHPEGLIIGKKVLSSLKQINLKPGNAMPLSKIPIGIEIHNIELYPGKGGQIIKTAGSSGVILSKDAKYVDIKLPSKEIRKILINCFATIGRISNVEHKLEKIGKAGRKRHMGIRPTVRGVAQHPASHPHGGGEGRSGIGMHPKTSWGKPAFGKITRKNKRTNKFIIKKRI